MSYDSIKKHWADSISFLTANDLKIFLLATANNVRRSLWGVLSYFWWFIILLSILTYITNVSFSIIVCFLYLLAARPSIERKDISYFIHYTPSFIAFFILWLPMYVLGLYSTTLSFLIVPYVICEAIFFLSALFYIDSAYSSKDFFIAVKNGFYAFFSFFPFLFVISAGFLVLLSFIIACVGVFCFLLTFMIFTATVTHYITQTFITLVLYSPLMLIVEFIFISALTIFYIKVKHTYPRLFFGK